jgi:hypothetical protein
MHPIKYLVLIFVLLQLSLTGFAQTAPAVQDTLPKFSLRNVGKNRIIVGWVNNYELVKQISIQRSFDSLGIYKTILSVTDPNAKQNGFADTKAPNDHMFYRLFVVLDKGQFYFTPPKKPILDTTTYVEIKPVEPEVKKPEPVNPGFVPSSFVYTNKEGYVFINLPDALQKKYHLKFFEEDGSFLFEIKNIRDKALTLDKANFYHAGWFNFELYNDEKLVEKHKFYLAKMF